MSFTQYGVLIVIVFFCLDLIITGIIGARRRKYDVQGKVLSILFLPIGLLGTLFDRMLAGAYPAARGFPAFVAGCTSALAGSWVLLIVVVMILDSYELISEQVMNALVFGSGFILIFGIIVLLAFAATKKQKLERQ